MLLRTILDGPAGGSVGAEATSHSRLSRDPLLDQRLLLVLRHLLPGLLPGVVHYPLSYFLPTLTKLCCVLIVCNKPCDL